MFVIVTSLESTDVISLTCNDPNTSKPSLTTMFVESVDSISRTSSTPQVIVPDAFKFLNSLASLSALTTTALLAAIVPFVMPSSFSRSVSFMSADPIINEPVAVTFLKSPMSLFESTTTALDAATVPAVTPSMVSSSASTISASPMVNPLAVTTPLASTAPSIAIVVESSALKVPANNRSSAIVIPVESDDCNTFTLIVSPPIVVPLAVIVPETSKLPSTLSVAESSARKVPANNKSSFIVIPVESLLVKTFVVIVSIVNAPDTLNPPSILIVPESSARNVPAKSKSSLTVMPVESVDDISLTVIWLSRLNVIVSPVIADVKLVPPKNLMSDVPGVTVKLFDDASENECVVAVSSLNVAILVPPVVAPSCTLIVLRSVSTVTSPEAPTNELWSFVVPRLNCT